MAPDWQDASSYDHFDGLDFSGLAWECLRRNEGYLAAFPAMLRGEASPRPWGLRFPG